MKNTRLRSVPHPLEEALGALDRAFADAHRMVKSAPRFSNLNDAISKKFDDPIENAENLRKAVLEDIDQDHADSMRAFDTLDAAFDRVRDELINFVAEIGGKK